jgi:arylformamidase
MNDAWIDISVPLHNGMVAWPGDAPFEWTNTLEIAKGDACNLSQISTTTHIGTHMDAPRHYLDGAAGIEAMPLTAAIGRARVIEIRDPETIRISEIGPHRLAKGERVLFKTRNSGHAWKSHEFQKKYVHIDPEAAGHLVECRVQTVGVDYLSVGGFDSGGQRPIASYSKQAFGSSKAWPWNTSMRANTSWSACLSRLSAAMAHPPGHFCGSWFSSAAGGSSTAHFSRAE